MIRILVFLTALLPAWAAAAEPVRLNPGELLRGRFVQERFLAGFDKPIRSEGSFVLAPGDGLLWQGEAPFPMVTAITQAGIVQSVDGTETSRMSSSAIPALAHLYDLMAGAVAGDWAALEGLFVVTRQGSSVMLKPRHRDVAMPIETITARVGRFVDEVGIVKPEGDRERLRFSAQKVVNGPLSAEEIAIFNAAGR